MSNNGIKPPSWKRLRPKYVVAATLLLVAAAIYLNSPVILSKAAEFLDVSDRPAVTEYCFVLGGGAESRPFLAAALKRRNLIDKVLIAHCKASPAAEDGIVPPHDELLRRVLVHEGVSEDAIIRIGESCSSTRDEAVALRKFLHEHEETKVTIVTTSYHTRRTRRVFRRELGALAGQLTYLGVPTEHFTDQDWWKSVGGFVTYLNEYSKLAYYCVRY